MELPANDTGGTTMKSGYDLPVYGLSDGSFYYLHVSALVCIFSSLSSVVSVFALSIRHKNQREFFTWTKSERFVVYLAICDGSFNFFHSMDHLHYVISKDHVHPKLLCQFYAFILAEFGSAQNILVNLIAINVFTLMFFKKNINFGKYDWKLLVITFGIPFIAATTSAVFDQLGPNGSFCLFDGVKGGTANIFFTTVPLLFILVMNIIMYTLTWIRIRQETKVSRTLNMENKSKHAAKNMLMFVAAFFIQWWALAVSGIWVIMGKTVPKIMYYAVTVFSNIGGCLNLCVFIFIRRNRKTTMSKFNKDNNVGTVPNKTSGNTDHGHP